MLPAVAITIDGVLRHRNQKIEQGQRLYAAFKSMHNILLLTDDTDPADVEDWLSLEGFYGYGRVRCQDFPDADKDLPAARLHQARGLNAAGYALDFIIDPDPAVAALLLKNGYNTMLFAHARFAVPSWRPDYVGRPRPWGEYEEEIEVNRRLWAAAQREPENDG